jgi:homoserine kinase
MEIHRLGREALQAENAWLDAVRCLSRHPRARVVVVAAPAWLEHGLETALWGVEQGEEGSRWEATRSVHAQLRTACGGSGELPGPVSEAWDECESLLQAATVLAEVTPRTRAAVLALGSALGTRLLQHHLQQAGVACTVIDPRQMLETRGDWLRAAPWDRVAQLAVQRTLGPACAQPDGPRLLVPGGVGAGLQSWASWMGPGGADLSATFVAAALGASRVVLWNSLPGLWSADPAVVADARPLEQLNYREAAELSFYSTEVLHARALHPVRQVGIPVDVRSLRDPEHPGTVLDVRLSPGAHPVKVVSAVHGQALISVDGRGVADQSRIASQALQALQAAGIQPTLISQASSQASVCMSVAEADRAAAEVALKGTFRMALSHGEVEDILVQPDISLVAVIGIGMAHSPGIAGRMGLALGEAGVNVLAIAQGSSELNITVAVQRDQADLAIRSLHAHFGPASAPGPGSVQAPALLPARGQERVRAFAPATVANVGPGFDVLGLAVQGRGDEVVAERIAGDAVEILEVTGDDGRLPLDARENTAGIAATEVLRRAGIRAGIGLRVHKGMPIGSGLGSSAASAAAAAVATNLLLGSPLRRLALIEACVEAETAVAGRHADNVAPAILGGLIMVRSVDPLVVQRIPVPEGLIVVVVTPAFELSTRLAREALPASIPLGAMVRNASHIATFVSACYANELGMLSDCVIDDVVTPQRARLIPGAEAVLRAATGAGALAASISGSGPSMFAFCHGSAIARRVAGAMQRAFRDAGLDSTALQSPADCPGAGRC